MLAVISSVDYFCCIICTVRLDCFCCEIEKKKNEKYPVMNLNEIKREVEDKAVEYLNELRIDALEETALYQLNKSANNGYVRLHKLEFSALINAVRGLQRKVKTKGEDMNLPDIETVSAKVHAAWMRNKLAVGVTSRKLESGEELMVPYSELSETAKQLDRGSVAAVYTAIAEALDGE